VIVVTTNGCFNTPLHPGHYFFLGFARGQGGELVVGINSTRYIRQKKGYEPASESVRAKALMDLGFIREVVVFHEPDPREFIRQVSPQVHCTGAEYSNGTCIEEDVCQELGIKLVYVPRIGQWSTRAILKGEVSNEGNFQGQPSTSKRPVLE
jgi:cytidyltransferase-like protein